MARQSQIRDLIFLQNAEPVPAQNIAFTTTATAFQLAQTDNEGGAMALSNRGLPGVQHDGTDLILQADADCYIRFMDVSSPIQGQVTGPTGANPGFLIKAGQSFAVCPLTSRGWISVKGVSASGNLTIFVSR